MVEEISPDEMAQRIAELQPAAAANGVVMAPLSSSGIFFSPDVLAKNRRLRAMRWPRFIHDHPAAIEEWQRHAIEVQRYQQELGAPSIDTAEPAKPEADDAAITSRKVWR